MHVGHADRLRLHVPLLHRPDRPQERYGRDINVLSGVSARSTLETW